MTHDIKDKIIEDLAKSLHIVLEGESAFDIQYMTGLDMEVCEHIHAQVKIIESESTPEYSFDVTNMIGRLNQLSKGGNHD